MRTPARFRRSAALALAAALAFALPAGARDLLGADAILKRLAEPEQPVATDPVSELKALVQTFNRESAGLAPELAATRWLTLYDTFIRLPREAFARQGYRDRLDIRSLIEALPAPEAWDALAAAIRARTDKATSPRDLALRILGAVIAGDHEAQTATLERLRAAVAANKKLEDYELENLQENIESIAAAIAASSDEAARLAAFSRELEKYESPSSSRRHLGSYLSIPDLVRAAGREAAEPLLRRALLLDVQLSLWSSDATQRVLAELALLEIDRLKRPHWSLVASLEDVALYEALDKKFPAKGSDRERRSATGVYLLGLVAAGRTEDATRLVFAEGTRFDPDLVGYAGRETLDQLQRAGRGDAVVDFLREVLTRDPTLPFWDSFISLSAQQSRARDALALLRTILARPDLAPATATDLRLHYCGALLAADEVDEGVAVLRTLIVEDQRAISDEAARANDHTNAPSDAVHAATPQARTQSVTGSGNTLATTTIVTSVAELASSMGMDLTPEILAAINGGDSDAETDEDDTADKRAGESAERIALLIKLGHLLEKPELVEEGLAAARALLPRLGKDDSHGRGELIDASMDALIAQDRAADAEAWLADHLAALPPTRHGGYRSDTQDTLLKLAALYGRLGRHDDVLRLFTGSPDFAVADLAELPHRNHSEAASSPHILIADALIATGRAEEARPILRRIVQKEPGCDAAYERLEKLGGADHETFLAQATRWDRFEERPLIWKARHQFAAGRLEEAEKTIRAAIAIDPSDGEQGKGDRMRAYTVLGDILEKRGDVEQAAIMRGAVAAIRLSEQADDWWAAGLLTRAVALYEKSLLKFADAYCIQSRLALRYNELGDFAKAEQHYRRAFELMPESFGRVESHCFGCEGAFTGPRAQTVAEKVFTELAVRMPDRAQVFYLLGYLRTEQERPAEAAGNFRKAVALDPDYLNAWDKLQSLAGAVPMPVAERETIALAILRLDPAGKHARPELDGIADLRKLWGTLLTIEATLPVPETGPLFEFSATRAKRDAEKKETDEFGGFGSFGSDDEPVNLRAHLSQNALFSTTAQFIEHTINR